MEGHLTPFDQGEEPKPLPSLALCSASRPPKKRCEKRCEKHGETGGNSGKVEDTQTTHNRSPFNGLLAFSVTSERRLVEILNPPTFKQLVQVVLAAAEALRWETHV